MAAGTTTYADSPVTSTCRGSPSVMRQPEAPKCSPSASTSLHQSVFGGRRPLPDMGRHPVKNLHGLSARRCHSRRVTVVESIDVLQHCDHRIVRGRHDVVSALSWGHTLVLRRGRQLRHVGAARASATRPALRGRASWRRPSTPGSDPGVFVLNRRKPGLFPGVEAAVEDYDILVAQVLQRHGS